MDKLAGDRRSVDRATWQRRTLEDEAADELEPLQGAAGERWWLGGADRGRVQCRAAVAASSWSVGGVARSWLAWLCSEWQNQGRDAAVSDVWMQLARSRRAQCTPTNCSVKYQGTPERSGEVGMQHDKVSDRGKIKGQGGLVGGSSSQCKLEIMPNLAMHSGCLTKCHRHLGISWSGQIFHILVSLDEQESGEVIWTKGETC